MSKAEIEKLIDYIRNHQNGITTRMERYHTQLENPGDIGHMYNIPGDYVTLTIQVYDPIPDKTPIVPKPAPTFEQRAESAIRDLEKRVDAMETLHKVNSHLSPEAKAELFAMQIMRDNRVRD